MGHSDATYSEAEEGFHSGAKGITHIFNAMRGIHHREPGIAGFGLMNKDVYIEVIADPFHLDQKIIELIFSTKNPDRIIIVSDTVKDTKPSSASQGVRSEENRILGGSLTVRKSSERLIKIGIDEEIVLKAVSENPVRYLGTV
jgi:N-acetylglucosamine-6-phosphate deacetylase